LVSVVVRADVEPIVDRSLSGVRRARPAASTLGQPAAGCAPGHRQGVCRSRRPFTGAIP